MCSSQLHQIHPTSNHHPGCADLDQIGWPDYIFQGAYGGEWPFNEYYIVAYLAQLLDGRAASKAGPWRAWASAISHDSKEAKSRLVATPPVIRPSIRML